MVLEIIYSLFDRPRTRHYCNSQYGEGFALGFRIGFALDSHWRNLRITGVRWAVVNEVAGQARATQEDTGRSWRRVKAVEASYPRTGDTRATSVAKQISGTRATSVANESKSKSASHGNTGAFSDKAKPAVTPICRITHGMAVGSEHRDCSIAQTPGRNHESDNASGTGQRCTCICSAS